MTLSRSCNSSKFWKWAITLLTSIHTGCFWVTRMNCFLTRAAEFTNQIRYAAMWLSPISHIYFLLEWAHLNNWFSSGKEPQMGSIAGAASRNCRRPSTTWLPHPCCDLRPTGVNGCLPSIAVNRIWTDLLTTWTSYSIWPKCCTCITFATFSEMEKWCSLVHVSWVCFFLNKIN